jgi:hypothetical protein
MTNLNKMEFVLLDSNINLQGYMTQKINSKTFERLSIIINLAIY